MSPSALFVTTVPITLEAFLTPFSEYFRGQGWRIDALANGASSAERIAGSFDQRYDVGWSRNPLAPRNFLGSAKTVRELVRQNRYDIVHVHTPIAAFVTRYALRSLKGAERPAVIYTAHGFHFFEGGSRAGNMAYRTMERAAAPWTDFLVTINDEDTRAARSLGLPASQVRHIPGIGVDLTRFSEGKIPLEQARAVREGLDVDPSDFMLTMIAELAPVKRHDHLLAALALTTNPAIRLVLVGDGPLESELREKTLALGITEKVRWAGYRRDVPAILAASDALALVSEREGLPRSVLEAMAAGTPVIGTRTRGITDAVESTGWIVAKDDVAALASAIDEAASNPDLTRQRGELARERAELFALPRIIDAYEELYREALASRV